MTQQELDALKALADAAQGWELAAFSPRAVSALIAEVERLRRDNSQLQQQRQAAREDAYRLGVDEGLRLGRGASAEVERLQVAWSTEHDAYIRADEQARMAKRDADELRGEVRELQNRLSAADPDIVWID